MRTKIVGLVAGKGAVQSVVTLHGLVRHAEPSNSSPVFGMVLVEIAYYLPGLPVDVITVIHDAADFV
jgi:hypothetical protein